MKKQVLIACTVLLSAIASAQTTIKGKIFDSVTKEALPGASVTDASHHTSIADALGRFIISTTDSVLSVSYNSYISRSIAVARQSTIDISLTSSGRELQQVVVSASRTAQKRSEAPVAIATISKQTIDDAKANRLDYLVNKVSGVFMVNLGNEQHEMSIRQPMGTSSVYLYLEDGIPIRTTGIYNHNALLEMNTAAAKQIEIIKGPASAAYGAEAIGGAVNVITQAPPAVANGMLSVQSTNSGYRRIDAQAGTTTGRLGLIVSGYFADRNNGPVQQSDFHKTAFTLRGDYKINNSTTWSNSATYVNYYSDMGGGSLDSAHFAHRDYTTQYTFNYRKVTALRIRSQLTHAWANGSETQLTAAYRDNSVGQNPSYYVINTAGNPLAAQGQINNSSFKSYLLMAQQVLPLPHINSRLVAGVSMDISPSAYIAHYINIARNSRGDYVSYSNTDSLLSNYKTGISNLASYINYDYAPFKGMKLVAALRYDHYHYNFVNRLPPSASTGAPSSVSDFNRVTPKLGLTYNYRQAGFYANYSQGYVPPQVTELFNSVKVPYLQPQTFFNYEIGGWLSLLQSKLYLDWSLYQMNGTNEIISVRQNDGSYQNQNSGKTRHHGIEYGITYKPAGEWMLRLSATNVQHSFVQDVEKGIDYSGHEMADAPHFIANAEVTYKPKLVKGLRIGAEWQHLGNYWMDNANSVKYPGFDVLNLRAGYRLQRVEFWVNALNAFNRYYAVIASKSTYGYTYNLGDPREFTLGVSVHFGKNESRPQ